MINGIGTAGHLNRNWYELVIMEIRTIVIISNNGNWGYEWVVTGLELVIMDWQSRGWQSWEYELVVMGIGNYDHLKRNC